ncbi:MAG: TonB family protein [Candidatus Omnitrophica bacterium]|nr:TonB family protein [Candidatus Omnitrophota bacterium]
MVSREGISKAIGDASDKDGSVFFKDDNKSSAFKLHYKKRPMPRIRFKGLLASGAARDRRLLYKPDLSVNRILPAEFSSDSSVTVMFKISRHGFVESPECIMSSGSSEVDQMALRYIRKWQFAPIDEIEEGSQEGMVRVVFDQI